MNAKGVLSDIFDWFTHAAFSEGTPVHWFAFVIFTMIAGLLWRTVIVEIIGDL